MGGPRKREHHYVSKNTVMKGMITLVFAAFIAATELTAQTQFQVDNQTSNQYQVQITFDDGSSCTNDCTSALCCPGDQMSSTTILSNPLAHPPCSVTTCITCRGWRIRPRYCPGSGCTECSSWSNWASLCGTTQQTIPTTGEKLTITSGTTATITQ